MRPRPPGLYRLGRLLRALGTVVVVVVFVVVGLAVYSATRVRPEASTSSSASSALLANGTAELSGTFNLSNPGYFGFSHFQLAARVGLPQGGLLGVGGSPMLDIPAGSTGSIPLTIYLPIAASPAIASLLTTDSTLPIHLWANTTYAGLVDLALHLTMNYSWGAPLAQFNATPGSPTLQPNGTVLVPVTVTFQDHAFFGVVGTVEVRVSSASGMTCADPIVSVATPAHGSFDQTFAIYASSACNPSGGQAVVTYTGNGLTYTFPAEALP